MAEAGPATIVDFTDADAVLRDTRRLRKRVQDRHRKATLGDQLYQAYVALFVGIPLVFSVTRAFDFVTRMPAAEIAALDGRIGVLLPIVLAMLTVAALRLAAWTGPVVVARADVAWLFSLPFARSRLIRPRLRRAFVVAAVVGALGMVVLAVGYLLSIGLDASDPGMAGRLLGMAVVTGTAYGLALAAVGWLVEVSRTAARILVRTGSVLVLLGVAAAAVVSAGVPPPPIGRVGLASGPWGWTTAALLSAVQTDAGSDTARESESLAGLVSPAAGQAGAAAMIILAAILATLAWRRAGAVPLEELRRRSATSAQVTAAAVYFADFRGAAQARDRVVRALIGRSRRRTPLPRRQALLVPWVGLTILLRQPRRIVQALLWLIAAAVAGGAGIEGVSGLAAGLEDGRVDPRILAVPLSIGFAYAAAGVLVEPLRVENEQRFALRFLPDGVTTVGPAHLIIPAMVLWLLSTVTVAVAAGFGALPGVLLTWGPLLSAAFAAALIAIAAVVASGPPADGLWLYSGGPGYGRLAFHLLRGPLLALVVVLVPVVSTQARLDPPAVVSMVVWAVAVTIGLGRWVQSRLQTF